MTKDDIIASKDAEIAFLRATIERLTAPKERSATAVRQERFRTNHPHPRGVTNNVTSNVTDNGQNNVTSLAPRVSPLEPPSVTPVPTLPPFAPKGAQTPKGGQRCHLDETKAYEDGANRGFSEAEVAKHLTAFRDYGDQVGWRSKAGPWKDYNAAFRTWLSHESPSGNGLGGTGNALTAAAEQAERDRVNAELDRERIRRGKPPMTELLARLPA